MDASMRVTPPCPSEDAHSDGGGDDHDRKPPAKTIQQQQQQFSVDQPSSSLPQQQLPSSQEDEPEEVAVDDDTNNNNNNKNGVTQSLPPSHILEDGRFIYLPPPSAAERSRFFERSIAKHGILEADMKRQDLSNTTTATAARNNNSTAMEEEEEAEEAEQDKTAPKIHPLAVASARLQSNGLNELNRAINLATLVQTGEYFSYTNIVDPSLEADAATTAGTKSTASSASAAAAAATVSSSLLTSSKATTQRIEALYCLKRKVTQFEKASTVLKRHEKRLRAGIASQKVIDRRLFQLRQQWRLVAPEHGTRARLHAARTNEVIAIDVEVYDDRKMGNNNMLGNEHNDSRKAVSLAGRLASRVPRFATIELQDNFQIPSSEKDSKPNGDKMNQSDDDVAMVAAEPESNGQDVEMESAEDKTNGDRNYSTTLSSDDDLTKYTRAEPFALADPSLGRVMENFDPSKIPMLSLQLDIQKQSTGFLKSARLEPMSTLTVANDDTEDAPISDEIPSSSDEDLLVSLQHSLFCANIFESIRNELDPDNVSSGTKNASTSFSPVKPKTLQNMAWLSSESDENFIPPPSFLVGGDAARRLTELSVIHCHEGEVKVQLDCEYQLCLKLVEANAEEGALASPQKESGDIMEFSGSQSPAQLHALCRALLLHAQDVYHQHSLYLGERERKKQEEEAANGDGPRGLARIKKEDIPEKARILQSCVSVGSKMLFEKRIRRALTRVSKWVHTTYGETLQIEWLALSIFDLHSKFAASCRQYVVDGVIARDALTTTRITHTTEDYRKAHFHSEREFEIYLRIELKRHLKK